MSNNSGKVSIVVVYNDPVKLQECIQYIQAQSIADSIEVVVIDNRNGSFPSAAAALNHGAAQSKNLVLVFMHQDLYLWDKNAIETYYAFLTQNPTVIAGVCKNDGKMHSDIYETKDKMQRMRQTNGAILVVWRIAHRI